MTKAINRAKESESLVLGTVITYKNAYFEVCDIIESPECFQENEHRCAWQAIQQIAREQRQIDSVAVAAQMRLIGGVEKPEYTVTGFKHLTHAGSGLRGHAMKVVENYLRISTRDICKRFATISDSDLNNADPFEFNEKVVEGLLGIVNQIAKVTIRDSKQVLAEFFDEVHSQVKAVREGAKIVGHTTGLQDLDEILGGYKPQKLYLLAARPAMGKSAFGCCHSPASISETAIPTGIVSTEMGRVELWGRIMARRTGIDSFTIQNGTLSDSEIELMTAVSGNLERMPIYIEDHNHSLTSLLSCIRQMVRRHKCKVVFVDYIQRIMADKTMSKANKNEMVGHFAKALKSIAKELDIAIVALAQLSREVERRPTKIPQLADLRDSGELEQEADVVIFMYRPSYYKEAYFMQQHQEIWSYAQSSFSEPMNWLSSLCYFEVSKHRGGKIGRFWSKYDKKTSAFYNIPKDVQARMGGNMEMPEAITPEPTATRYPF